MPTTYNDQFYLIDPANPPAQAAELTVVRYDLVDQNDDGDIDRFNADSVNGQDVTRSWPGDTVTVTIPGEGRVTFTGITFYLADGSRVFTPTDGQVLQDGRFHDSSFVTSQGGLDVGDLGPPCFTPGTMILTPDGERAIETLLEGQLVTTRDRGPQPLRWIGETQIDGQGPFAPIRFEAGVFGLKQALTVSPQHRMVIEDWRATYLFGHGEVFAAAKHLVNGTTVRQVPMDQVRYVHLLFDRHEIVRANGAWSESYFPAHAATGSDRATSAEVLALFPELATRSVAPARPVIRAFEARLVAPG